MADEELDPLRRFSQQIDLIQNIDVDDCDSTDNPSEEAAADLGDLEEQMRRRAKELVDFAAELDDEVPEKSD